MPWTGNWTGTETGLGTGCWNGTGCSDPFGFVCVGGVGGLVGRGAQVTELILLFVAIFVTACLDWDLVLLRLGEGRPRGFLLKGARHLRAFAVLVGETGVFGGLQAGEEDE